MVVSEIRRLEGIVTFFNKSSYQYVLEEKEFEFVCFEFETAGFWDRN